MRRKDLKYYLKTIQLKWNAIRFAREAKSSTFQSNIANRRREYLKKWDQTFLKVQVFSPYYPTYFYLKDTSIFDGPYHFENGFPISLKDSNYVNPLFPIYYGLVDLNTNKYDSDLHESISKYIFDISNDNRLEYTFDYSLFGLKAPWISGITQSLGTSYLLRQYTLTKNINYLEKAKGLFSVCLLSIQSSGLLRSTKSCFEWVEEYPSDNGSFVLNGHMFAIIAALELYQVTEEEIYKHTANQWIKSLLFHLPEYQYDKYLLHNKRQNKLSNIEYQGLYVGLFKHLSVLTKHPLFMEFHHFYNSEMDWPRFNRFYGI